LLPFLATKLNVASTFLLDYDVEATFDFVKATFDFVAFDNVDLTMLLDRV